MKKSKKSILMLTQGAIIAALYVALTYGQELLLPGTTSMAIQFRASEALTVLACFTPSAIPGLAVGCFIANIMNVGALPVDMILGTLATLLAALAMYFTRKITFKGLPLVSCLMPAVFNGIIIGAEIEIFFIDGPFHFASFLTQGGLVALGELGVLYTLGLVLCVVFSRQGIAKKLKLS